MGITSREVPTEAGEDSDAVSEGASAYGQTAKLANERPDDVGFNFQFEFALDNPAFSDKVLEVVQVPDIPAPPGQGVEEAVVRKFPVNSAILAAQSDVFLKMFSNGMLESGASQTVRLHATQSELEVLPLLLRVIYTGKLAVTTSSSTPPTPSPMTPLQTSPAKQSTSTPPPAPLKDASDPPSDGETEDCAVVVEGDSEPQEEPAECVKLPIENPEQPSCSTPKGWRGGPLVPLMLLADKFNVRRCVAACAEQLQATSAAMSVADGAACLLLLPETLQAQESVQPLVEAALKVVVGLFEWYLEEEAIKESPEARHWRAAALLPAELPIAAVEAILKHEDLNMVLEENLFMAVLGWCRRQYGVDLEERRAAFLRLAPLIRFPQMSAEFMAEVVQKAEEMQGLEAMQLLLEAALFRSFGREQRAKVAEAAQGQHTRYVPRCMRHCVYLTVTVAACRALRAKGEISSEVVTCFGRPVQLLVQRGMSPTSPEGTFGLFLKIGALPEAERKLQPDATTVQFNLLVYKPKTGVWQEPCDQLVHTFPDPRKGFGYMDFFSRGWNSVLTDEEIVSQDGQIRLCADVLLRKT